MRAWENQLRVKINLWRLKRYRLNRRGHVAAKRELRETQAWCAAKADLARPKDCFRDERLRPALLTPSQLDAVDNVRRSRGLYSHRHIPLDLDLDNVIAGGRLIAYSPDNQSCLRHV